MHDVISGVWIGNQEHHNEDTFPVIDPATGEAFAEVCDADHHEWDLALDRAQAAFPLWAATPPRQRSEFLRAIYQAIIKSTEEFAVTMTRESGKPIAESRAEVAYGAEYFRWFAEEAVRGHGRIAPAPAGTGTIVVTRKPVGVVLAITPWNFPLAMATRKIAPALAAGCPIMVKPAEETPLTLVLLGRILAEVLETFSFDPAIAAGLVSILPTTKAAQLSSSLMADKRLKKVSFTGSTRVGKLLVTQAAQHLQRTSMELGGNAPFLIAPDADLDRVIDCAMQAKMRNAGQACVAANRFLVPEELFDAFQQRLIESMSRFRCGHGLNATTTLGPLISNTQRDRVAALVDQAIEEGATLLYQGSAPSRGFFYPATVLSDVTPEQTIYREEIFGPVVTLTKYQDLEEAINLANDTDFGLAAYLFSENVHTVQYLASRLDAGMLGINKGAVSDPAAPFGGIKESGFGREGGVEGIEEYQNIQYQAW